MPTDMEFADEPFDDQLEKQPAPRTERAPTRTAPKKTTTTTPPYKQGVLLEPITTAYGFLGMGVGILEAKGGKLHMPVGSAIVESAERCAEAWDTAAKTSPAMRRVLYKLVGSSNFLALALAHAPIAVAVSNEIPAVQRLSQKFGSFLQNMVRVDESAGTEYEYSEGSQYAYPNESLA